MYGIDDLILFVKTVEIGSFANTAKVLKVAPQAVSRRIRNMEQRLGITLIHATTREFKLTETGEQLYNMLQNSTDTVDKMLRNTEKMVSDKHEPQGTIRVVLPAILSLHKITPYIPEFSIKYPKIDLHIRYLNSDIDIVHQGYDIALLNHLPSQQHLKIKNVFNAKAKLYCTRKYAEKYGLPETPKELLNHSVVGFMNADGSMPSHYELTNIKTGKTIFEKMPKHLITNNAQHSLMLIKSNELICGAFADLDSSLEMDDIVKVLPEYYMLELKFYCNCSPLKKYEKS